MKIWTEKALKNLKAKFNLKSANHHLFKVNTNQKIKNQRNLKAKRKARNLIVIQIKINEAEEKNLKVLKLIENIRNQVLK